MTEDEHNGERGAEEMQKRKRVRQSQQIQIDLKKEKEKKGNGESEPILSSYQRETEEERWGKKGG